MWKRKLNFLSGYLLDPITSYLLDPINKVNKFIPGWKVHELGIHIIKTGRDFDKFTDKNNSELKINISIICQNFIDDARIQKFAARSADVGLIYGFLYVYRKE